ncbi:MAG: excinuclease ABC subunit C, partial [Nitrospirae bacterium GWC2_42_7]
MKEKLLTIPAKPGVYIFKDKADRILYVGKAKDLKNRVKSYFQRSSGLDMRKTAMIKSVSDIEYTVTGNELEALVLEANLIKQHRPRYNVLLRDDKSYPYLKLTINEEWPRLEVVRRINKDGSRYFGPYVPSGPMWKILSFIKDNFHIRTCRQSLEKRMRPCIQHQIKKCAGPCAGLINHNKYMDMINEIRLLLEGKNNKLLVSLEKKMQRFSEKLRYEEAGVVRDRIVALQKISETQKAATPGLGDIDVIGSFKEENIIVFKILFLRNGIMIGSKDFRLKNISDETPAYLMKNLIEQFYEKEIIPPAKIICSDMPEDAAILSPWLSDKKGSHVTIIAPKRGQKRRLVEMAEENAEIIYNSGKYSGRDMLLQKVAERLGLNIIPKDIGAF